jgi:hypothetical protein
MKTILLRAGLALLATVCCLRIARAEVRTNADGRTALVSRDATGRVLSRTVMNDDGSRHTTATEYWAKSQVVKRSVDEDLDRSGRPTKRVVREYDDRGRVRESRAVSIDDAGKERGTRTRYGYDAEGRSHKTTSQVER